MAIPSLEIQPLPIRGSRLVLTPDEWERARRSWVAMQLRHMQWRDFLRCCFRFDPVDRVAWQAEYERRTLLRPAAAAIPVPQPRELLRACEE